LVGKIIPTTAATTGLVGAMQLLTRGLGALGGPAGLIVSSAAGLLLFRDRTEDAKVEARNLNAEMQRLQQGFIDTSLASLEYQRSLAQPDFEKYLRMSEELASLQQQLEEKLEGRSERGAFDITFGEKSVADLKEEIMLLKHRRSELEENSIHFAELTRMLKERREELKKTTEEEEDYSDALKSLGELDPAFAATQKLREDLSNIDTIVETLGLSEQRAAELREDAYQRYKEDVEDVNNSINDLSESVQEFIGNIPEVELLPPGQRDALAAANAEYKRAQQNVDILKGGTDDAADATNDLAEEATEMERTFERVAGSVEDEFSDAFYNIFEDGFSAFDDLADGILDIFKRTLADMAAAAIRQQIVVPITQQIVGGAGDILSGGQSLLSGGGAGDLLGSLTQAGAGADIASSFARSGVGQSLGLSTAISPGPGAPGNLALTQAGSNISQAAGSLTSISGIAGGFIGSELGGGTQEANIGSTLGTVAGSFIPGIGSFVGGLVGGALGGLFSDDPDPSSVKAAISAAGDVDVSVRKGDAISRKEADKLEDTFSSTLNQYTDSLDQAIENTIDSSLEEQIGDDGITTRKINKIVEKYIGGDEGSIQKGISRVMEEVTRSLTFIIPEDIHEATRRLDEEADNYGEQVMAITNAFAMSNGDLVGELRHFIDNTEATGQQFVDQLSQFSQQLQERERQIAERTHDLSTQLLQSFGRTAELIKAQLAGMTSENAALQIALNLRENVADAEQEVASAEQELASIYQEQANEASNLADQWKGLTDTLRDAADELIGVGVSQPRASRTSFRDTLQRALSGDREAFEALPQLASDLSDAERSQARTLADSRRANAKIAVELSKAADRAEKEFLNQRSELQVAEKQLEKLTEQEITLQQARSNLAESQATLKAAQDASTQAINKIGELLPNNIVNGLMEPLSPLKQIDASTQAMVNLLSQLGSTGFAGPGGSGEIINESGTGVTTRPGVGMEPDRTGPSNQQIVESAYEDLLGLRGDFEDSQERMAYWGEKLAKGELTQENFRDEFLKEAQVQGGLTREQFERNQQFLEENSQGFADGGIASGPMSGYNATLHGTEAVIPLNGERIPLEVNNQEMIQELRELRQEVNQLRTEQGQSQYQITKNTKRTRETLEQFDIEGLPPERSTT
jgi:DNA repair exonuclease SbcCD ATPase subunit